MLFIDLLRAKVKNINGERLREEFSRFPVKFPQKTHLFELRASDVRGVKAKCNGARTTCSGAQTKRVCVFFGNEPSETQNSKR